MSYKLFLDDMRNPPDRSWVVVRSFDAFVEHITTYGYPYLIWFDHDLGTSETGLTCAKWLVNRQLDDGYLNPIEFGVHSANPPGRDNIAGLLTGWETMKELMREDFS